MASSKPNYGNIPTLKLNSDPPTSVPWIGFGTGTAFYGKDNEKTIASIHNALKAGFRHLDGAQMYNNEAALGEGLARFLKENGSVERKDVFVTTKLTNVQNYDTTGKTAENAVTALDKSLARLQLDYVDLYLIHMPKAFVNTPGVDVVWKDMIKTVEQGKAKAIGVSNFQQRHLQTIVDLKKSNDKVLLPVVNQIEYHVHLLEGPGDPMTQLLEFHQQHGIVTSSYGGLNPLYKEPGQVPARDHLKAVLRDIAKDVVPGFDPSKDDRETETHLSQVLTLWSKQKGILVVTTTGDFERATKYVDTADLPALSAEQIKKIDDAGKAYPKRYFEGNWPSKD